MDGLLHELRLESFGHLLVADAGFFDPDAAGGVRGVGGGELDLVLGEVDGGGVGVAEAVEDSVEVNVGVDDGGGAGGGEAGAGEAEVGEPVGVVGAVDVEAAGGDLGAVGEDFRGPGVGLCGSDGVVDGLEDAELVADVEAEEAGMVADGVGDAAEE